MAFVGRKIRVPRGSVFLFGPRGSGKTTFLQHACPEALRVDLLAPDVYRRYLARPERLHDLVQANPAADTVIIDEIQKVPDLLSVVHQIMDGHPDRRFILTGSSSRKLKRAGVDLLAGRAIPTTMHPFIAAELGPRFDLGQALQLGLVPLVVTADDPAATLAGYVSIYLQEEVQTEGLVRNIGDFSRFLEAISFSHGSVLTISDVARECEVKRKTVEGFLQVFEDLLLGFQLPVFARRAKRNLIKHRKFYVFDCGVFRSLRPSGPLDRSSEIEGAALEGLVAQHLRAWIDCRGRGERLYFWRTKAGLEVDFVVYGGETFAAVEVKNSRRISRKDTRNLREFRTDYPESLQLLVYRGDERLELGGVLCIPAREFLLALDPGAACFPA